MIVLITKLFLAHILGDFILQPSSWVTEKTARRLRSGKLYLHGALHGVISALLVWEQAFVAVAAILTVVHILIDLVKLSFQKGPQDRKWFVYDQILHVVSILVIAQWYTGSAINIGSLTAPWLIATSVIFLTLPSSIIIRTLISVWAPKAPQESESDLQNAGKYIGILERLFVFAFIVTGHFEGVGFLLAAKSIFRFGDLTQARDRRLTEYVMIGTLLSFGLAVAAGLAVDYFSVFF